MYKTYVYVCSMAGQTVTALPPHRTKMTDPPRRRRGGLRELRTWTTWRRKCPLWVLKKKKNSLYLLLKSALHLMSSHLTSVSHIRQREWKSLNHTEDEKKKNVAAFGKKNIYHDFFSLIRLIRKSPLWCRIADSPGCRDILCQVKCMHGAHFDPP